MVLIVLSASAALVGAYLMPTFRPLQFVVGWCFTAGVASILIGTPLHWFGEFNTMAAKTPELVILERMAKSLDEMVTLNKKILQQLRAARPSDLDYR